MHMSAENEPMGAFYRMVEDEDWDEAQAINRVYRGSLPEAIVQAHSQPTLDLPGEFELGFEVA